MADNDRNTSFDLQSMMHAGFALQRKAFDLAQSNVQNATDFMGNLVGCRSALDVTAATQEFATKQVSTFQEQTKEMLDLANNIARNGQKSA